MLRRSVLSIAVAVLLVAAGGTLAHAWWRVSQPAADVALQTSDFRVHAQWNEEPTLTNLFPGDARTATAQVSLDSAAQWQYRVDYASSGPLAPYLTAVWFPNTQCSGTPHAMGQTNPALLTGGTATEICVRFSLSNTAPSRVQGTPADVTVTVTAEQRR
ncbi:hypothetical protein [Bogoriella caseilytica]|uniref:Ribosomally synthesized peptide with SipW-like signal peptide n=1 Tax=Bogoriella caseilytica TaxID=56055 RepID=A0A3N2BDM3_9MICO|nr:hypothetical protein [Bogoriella caseilytica]ROR73353.1 hypothetical protein EDD31_1730 [Bogoriella caseilytica]